METRETQLQYTAGSAFLALPSFSNLTTKKSLHCPLPPPLSFFVISFPFAPTLSHPTQLASLNTTTINHTKKRPHMQSAREREG